MRLPLSQPSAWMAAASASSAKACSGLTAASLPDASEPSFQKLCRAVGGKWGVVSADTLFRLRRGMNEEDQLASLAFNQLFSAVDVPEVAELITSAASKHNSFGSLAAADKTAASVIHRAAQAINAQSGGLYAGNMECLRATICDPRFGLNLQGTCLGCSALLSDASFLQRLRRKAMALDQPERRVISSVNKRTLTVDELRAATASQHEQARAEKKVRVRAESLKDKWRRNFDAAMEERWRNFDGSRLSHVTYHTRRVV